MSSLTLPVYTGIREPPPSVTQPKSQYKGGIVPAGYGPQPAAAPIPVQQPYVQPWVQPSVQAQPGSGAAGVGIAATPPPAPNVNTAAPPPQLMQSFNALSSSAQTKDPFQQEAIQNIRNRMSVDNTKRAIQGAQGASQDALAGQIQAARERAAAGGTSQNIQNQVGALGEQAARNEAGQAAGITLGREQSLDALALGSAGIFNAPSVREGNLLSGAAGAASNIASAQNASLASNVDVWRTQQQAAQQQQALAMQAAQQQQNAMMSLYQSLY